MELVLLLAFAIFAEFFFEKGVIVEPLFIDKPKFGGSIRSPGILTQARFFVGSTSRANADIRRQLFATDATFKRTVEIRHRKNSIPPAYFPRVTLASSPHSASI